MPTKKSPPQKRDEIYRGTTLVDNFRKIAHFGPLTPGTPMLTKNSASELFE